MNQRYAKMSIKNGVLHIVFKPVVIDRKAAKKIVSDRQKLQNQEILPVLCDIRNLKKVDIDARDYFALSGWKLTKAVAILADPNYTGQLARIYIMASKPVVPTAIFINSKDAYEFLNQSEPRSSSEIKMDPTTPVSEEFKKLNALIDQMAKICAGDLSKQTHPTEEEKKTMLDTLLMALNMLIEHIHRQPIDAERFLSETSGRLFFLDKNLRFVGHSTRHEDPIVEVDQEEHYKKSFLESLTRQSQKLLIEKYKELKQLKKVSLMGRQLRLDIRTGDYEAIPVNSILEIMNSKVTALAINIYYNPSYIDLEKKVQDLQSRNHYADTKAANEIYTSTLSRRIFQRIKNFSEDNIYEIRPSFEDIVADSGTVYHNFDRIFKRHHGVTIRQYHNKMRTKRIAREISEGELLFREISQIFGYRTQGSLSRAFKREMGCTPEHFKKLSKCAQDQLVKAKLNV